MAVRCKRLAGLGFGLGLAFARAALAVDWHLETQAGLSQEFHSNIRLLPRQLGPRAVWGADLGFTTRLIAREAHWQVQGRARLQNQFYAPIEHIDAQNQFLDLDAHYATERSRWALTANYTDDALLASQSDELVGIVLTRVQRSLTSFAPAWTYAWSERTRSTLGYAYHVADYETRTGFGYVDSTTHTASVGLEHQLTERLGLNGTLAYTAYRADQRAIDYVNAMAGFQYAVTETLDIGVSGGGQYSFSETELRTFRLGLAFIDQPPTLVLIPEDVTLKDAQFGPLVTATARQRFESSEWQLDYSHKISPSINGTLFESDRVALTGRHRFSERLNASLSLAYTDQARPSFNGNTLSQAYYRLGADFAYTLTEHWHLSGSYRYVLRDLGDRDGAFSGRQDDHAVFLRLKYDFDPFQF